ncbi:MAG: NADPH-dependent reductase [Hydrocarboniphaga sp.]|uniref:NADPH-dependent F420 reductase n=1 Tax=Hydrocarboniphaga sp. TaxID=2033016 RepID=UPI0026263F58|nr:NADPH-dependent F420 reductase [Hydrocarboniphaga sp.]MDB5968631.1 NADPH-dependent reductase [Hydrocarboniphaga sp.]
MRIAVVGGTGKEGGGMAIRWAHAGHDVFVGSRDAERAKTVAIEFSREAGRTIRGGSNAQAIEASEIVVLSVPYSAHTSTLQELKTALAGRVLIDITVPLQPPKITSVNLPAGQSAALEAQAILGAETPVVAAMHHVSAVHLRDLSHDIDCDVLACSDDKAALEQAMALIRDLGVRSFDVGPLRNAIAIESLTPLLLHLNRQQKGRSVGIRITGA